MRYARVGTNIGGVAAKIGANRLLGRDDANSAASLAATLGNLKGPLMKVAQLLATVPDVLPPEYAEELSQLQSNAPPMGPAFVKRRMTAELGLGWERRFKSFDRQPAHAASLGQVHKAVSLKGEALAVKLQYPDMASAVEADLSQLDLIFSLHRRMGAVIDTTEIRQEISERIREELDYEREARHAALYAAMLSGQPLVRVPSVHRELSTRRLLTMGWLEGRRLLDYKTASLEDRNRIAKAMFTAWWHPFAGHGVIHGDPHLGNYSAFEEDGRPEGINLLDYGCVRIFPPSFVAGVVELYRGLQEDDEARIVSAYETWGFKGLTKRLVEILNIWARFIYGPLLDDRVRTIADGVSPGAYGRKEAFRVHQALKEEGPVRVPREFVFMDRAAIGLGAVFLHLAAELNFHTLFNEAIEGFRIEDLAARQQRALEVAGL
ncbi:putative ubiquinone biosynthesis protein UbiB [Hartmannibacter diazotrophicus]|uniref:Putative ubiquinone biosynthesis protein UbiB n=1 Tax=Hartmannibacter diazotrophicus TaxID=1482074 RepID=A0A2C9DC85_9HYPH|nr:AarF/UbiB family protein [Hartmannibacter diazotrophicus]SON57215.1 putative ubiquinone biosynthesis protein UbiB [Hartmannibacter diazotrophicus]